MKYRGDTFYTDHNCTVLHDTVTGINAQIKHITLASGKQIPFDKLLVATGSSPFVPPFAGLDTVKDQCTFMSLDDAEWLGEKLAADKKVLIIGAGLIGLKCAEGIAAKGTAHYRA